MTRLPARILLRTAEPCQSDYVEAVLALEAPGWFEVLREAGSPADLCVAVLDAASPASAAALATLQVDPSEVPTLAVSPWQPEVAVVDQLMRAGAEDVLGLAELSPRRLVAALVKALARQGRHAGRAAAMHVNAVPGVILPAHNWLAATAPEPAHVSM